MRWIGLFTIVMACAGCGVATQPASAKTVAAFEVPLPTEQERNQFLSILRQVAKTEGFHVDADSDEELQQAAQAVPLAKMTLHAAIWRDPNDKEDEAVVMDQADYLGLVWIMFSKGQDPELNTKFRNRTMKAIFARWPDTRSLPIMPTGAIPLHQDLLRSGNGYKVVHSAAAKYELAHR